MQQSPYNIGITDIKTDTEAVLLKGAIKIEEEKMRICVIATILNMGEMITDMIEVVGRFDSLDRYEDHRRR